MSRWECVAGHVFEGNFFSLEKGANGNDSRRFATFACPACGEDMILSRDEGARLLIGRIREFVQQVCKDPMHKTDGTLTLADVNRLEITIKRLAEEAARP